MNAMVRIPTSGLQPVEVHLGLGPGQTLWLNSGNGTQP